ncbi:hypothetical protein HA050_20180 [Iodobacter sp. HSC-16F04]|uniref:Uncharacterized protein n=1 Tax=Iodobacter violaceini TaxID=3044271 RepID=A0ABX0L1M3_9NEIS|nr:hypothetical protein [Iodobacter violacea]NHQ88422.1 hypothetical protein [Iodobacter violacea]
MIGAQTAKLALRPDHSFIKLICWHFRFLGILNTDRFCNIKLMEKIAGLLYCPLEEMSALGRIQPVKHIMLEMSPYLQPQAAPDPKREYLKYDIKTTNKEKIARYRA